MRVLFRCDGHEPPPQLGSPEVLSVDDVAAVYSKADRFGGIIKTWRKSAYILWVLVMA